MSQLPPIGAEIPCSRHAINAPLRIKDAPAKVEFRGGIKYRVEPNPNDPMNSVRLRIVGHRVSAELPAENGGQAATITLEQDGSDMQAATTLRQTQQMPPKYEMREVTSFTMAIEQPGAGVTVLVTKEPMVLTAELTEFPPRAAFCTLDKPVELVDQHDPTKVLAVIEDFPVKVGGL
jgi:hypothetical protein